MNPILLNSYISFFIFDVFAFAHVLDPKSVIGWHPRMRLAIDVSGSLAAITALVYLIFCGYLIKWWVPLLLLFLSSTVVLWTGNLIYRTVGYLPLCLSAFIGWPFFAYYMFHFILTVH
jgi:hypothetical protein